MGIDTMISQALENLIDLIGEEAAYKLVDARGGTKVYIPQTPGGEVAEIVGVEACAILSAQYGRNTIKIPMDKSWQIGILTRQGLSQTDIATRLKCDVDTVKRSQRRERTAPAQAAKSTQLSLFD
jgi:hypothetical protein